MSFFTPRVGVHSIRLFDFAIVDILFTLVFAWGLQRYVYTDTSMWYIALFAFFAGIVVHRLFGIKTKVDTILFGA